MEIVVRDVIPEPLSEVVSKESQVWGTECRLDSGAIVHVVAPSGTGKSTFLGVLSGERQDHKGKVSVGGETLSSRAIDRLRSSLVSFVFQDLALIGGLSALENIHLKNELNNTKTEEEIVVMARSLQVESVLHQKASTLSRGEAQRIAIIRSLCSRFKWLILDEPFSHLDEENRSRAIQLIQEEVRKQEAGLILLNVEKDNYFPYSKELRL